KSTGFPWRSRRPPTAGLAIQTSSRQGCRSCSAVAVKFENWASVPARLHSWRRLRLYEFGFVEHPPAHCVGLIPRDLRQARCSERLAVLLPERIVSGSESEAADDKDCERNDAGIHVSCCKTGFPHRRIYSISPESDTVQS